MNAQHPLPHLEDLIAPFLPDCEELALDLLNLPQPHVPAGVTRPAGQELLTAMCRDQLASGGKRLRALLTPAIVAAAGGPVPAARVFGAAVELIHNGTLVHDDIQDGDTLRRGRPTLWTQFGVPQGINAGDALLMGAVAGVLRAPEIADPLKAPLGALLAEALCETIRGQVADLALRDLPQPSLTDIASVHLAKTGPLFSACFVGAVRLLQRGAEAEKAAYVLGREIGLAFQIRDDLLDLLGTKGRGDAGADLREGKPTWPVLVALRDVPGPEADAIRALLRQATQGSPPSDAAVAHAVAWVREVGGEATARAHLADTLGNAAVAAREAFDADSAVVALALCERLARLDG